MTILAVDNENLMLNRLCRHITQIKPDSLVVSFKNPADALAYMENHTVDVVFLEIMLQKMMGIELARQMQQINPHVNIILHRVIAIICMRQCQKLDVVDLL